MQQNKISILSTRPLKDSLINEAKERDIQIDVLSFIETAPVRSTKVQQEIECSLLRSATVVFTSMNAVEAVADKLQDQQPGWKIYCIGTTTRQLVKKYFGEESIAGSAPHATELANLVARGSKGEQVLFFCGDQRRDELPEKLRSQGMDVHEIIVYHTITIPAKAGKNYDGILFFSPSAVESFFMNNYVTEQTSLFAIGGTTANAIKKHTNNTIIICEQPGKENLIRKMIAYYTEKARQSRKFRRNHNNQEP